MATNWLWKWIQGERLLFALNSAGGEIDVSAAASVCVAALVRQGFATCEQLPLGRMRLTITAAGRAEYGEPAAAKTSKRG